MYEMTLHITNLDTELPQIHVVPATGITRLKLAYKLLDAIDVGTLVLVKQAVARHQAYGITLKAAITSVFTIEPTSSHYANILRMCEAHLTLREALGDE